MLTATHSHSRFAGAVQVVAILVLLGGAGRSLGAEPFSAEALESLGESASLLMPQVEHHLSRADRAREADEWWQQVAPIYHLLDAADPHVLRDHLGERFVDWAVDRFFAEEAVYSFDRLLSTVAQSNLEHLYIVDEGGAVELDGAGAPRMRTTAGLSEDREEWRALVSASIEEELNAWEIAFDSRRAAILAGIDPHLDDNDSLTAEIDGAVETADEGAGRAYRRELEAIMRLEEQRFVAKRTRDQWSLRRASEEETAERIVADLIADSEERLADGLLALEDALDGDDPDDVAPVDVDAEAWRESFREQFRAGARRWDEAEERLIAERVEWEREAGVNLEEGERVWAEAYRELRDARAQWQRELRAVIEQGRLRWENEHEALEATIAEAQVELEQAIAEREASAQERIGNLVEMYAAARDTLRTTLDSAEHWLGMLRYAEGDPRSIGDREALDAVLAEETAGAFETLADTFESSFFAEPREELEAAQAALDEWYDEQSGDDFGGTPPYPPGWQSGGPGMHPAPPEELVADIDAAEDELARREESAAFAGWLVDRGFDAQAYEELVRGDGHAAVGIDLDALSGDLAQWDNELSVEMVGDIFERLFASFSSRYLPGQLMFWSQTWRRYESQAEAALADLMATYGVTLTGEPFAPGDGPVAFDELLADGGVDSIYLDEYQIELLRSRATEQYWAHQLSIAESVHDYATDRSSDRHTEAQTQERFDSALAELESAQEAYAAAAAELDAAGRTLAGDREALTQAVAAIDSEQQRLAAAREEYRTIMDLHMSESFDFYKRRIAAYFEELAESWGLTHDGGAGDEWRALVEYRRARAAHEAESRYAHAWEEIATVVDAIAASEYERWEFSGDAEAFEASLAGFHEADESLLSGLYDRWDEVRHDDAAAAEALRIEIETLAGRVDAIARAEHEALEEQLALLTAPSPEAWLERSGVEATLAEHDSYEDLRRAIRDAEAREEVEWIARRAEREREAIELVLTISGDGAELPSLGEFIVAADSSGAGAAARDLAVIYWKGVTEGEEGAPGAEHAVRLESAHAALGGILDALESLDGAAALESRAIADALRPVVQAEKYASRFLTGTSLFATDADDLSRSIAEADRAGHRTLRSLRHAIERHGETAPALARLRSDDALASIAETLAEEELIAWHGDGEIELVAPAQVAARLRWFSVDELGAWRSALEQQLLGAASAVDGALSSEIVGWLDAAVGVVLADPAVAESPAYYAELADERADRLDGTVRSIEELDLLGRSVRDSARSERSRLAAVIERWGDDPAYAEEREAVAGLFAESVSSSVAAELAYVAESGSLAPDGGDLGGDALQGAAPQGAAGHGDPSQEAALLDLARAKVGEALETIGATSLEEEYGETIAAHAVERYEAARLRFADSASIEWEELDDGDRLLLTLDRWESIPPELIGRLVGGVDSTAVALVRDFAAWAGLTPESAAPGRALIEQWLVERYFDGSRAEFDVYGDLDRLEEVVLSDRLEALDLERESIEPGAFEAVDPLGYAQAGAFLESQVELFESIAGDDELAFPDYELFEHAAADRFARERLESDAVAAFVDALWSQLSAAVDTQAHSFSGDRSAFESALTPELTAILGVAEAGDAVDAAFGELGLLDYLDALAGFLSVLAPADRELIDERSLVEALFAGADFDSHEHFAQLLAGETAGAGSIEAAKRAFLDDPQRRFALFTGADANEESSRLGMSAEFVYLVREAAGVASENGQGYESPRAAFLAEVLDLPDDRLAALIAAEKRVGALAAAEEDDASVSARIAEVLGLTEVVEILSEVEELDLSVADPYRRATRAALSSDHGAGDVAWLEEMLGLAHAGVQPPVEPESYFAASDIGEAYEAIAGGRSGAASTEIDHEAGRIARAVQEKADGWTGFLDGGAAQYAARAASSPARMFEIAAALEGVLTVDDYVIGSGERDDITSLLAYERSAVKESAAAALSPIQRLIDEQTAALYTEYEAIAAERDLYFRLEASAERADAGEYAARAFNDDAYLPADEPGWSIESSGLDSAADSPEERFVLATFGRSDDWSGQERVASENELARASQRIERMYAGSDGVLDAAADMALSGEAAGRAFHLHFANVGEESLFETASGAVAGGTAVYAPRRSTEMHLERAGEDLTAVRSRADQLQREISSVGGGIRAARESGEERLIEGLTPVEAEIGLAESELAALDAALFDAIEAFEATNERYTELSGTVGERSDAVQEARLELRRAEAVLEFASSGYIGAEEHDHLEDSDGDRSLGVDPEARLDTARHRYDNARVARKALESLHTRERSAPDEIDISEHPELAEYQEAFTAYRSAYEDRLALQALEALFADALARQEQIVTDRFEEVNDTLAGVLEPVAGGPDSGWSDVVAFTPGDDGELPQFTLTLETGGDELLSEYFAAEHEAPRQPDDPEKSDFERHRHDWMLDVGRLIDDRGLSVLGDWGLAAYHRDLGHYRSINRLLRYWDRLDSDGYGTIPPVSDEPVRELFGVDADVDLREHRDRLDELRSLLGSRVEPPSDKVESGIADFLEGNLLRGEIEYKDYLSSESAAAYDRVAGDAESRRLFEYYAGLSRVGGATGEATYGIFERTAGASMFEFIISELSEHGRDQHNKAVRNTALGAQLTATGLAMLPWPPAYVALAAAAGFYATAAGHAVNSRNIGEVRRDAERDSRSERRDARAGREALRDTSRSYERSYAELIHQRGRLATLRGVDGDRDGGMDLADLAASVELAAEVMGVELSEYLGDERFADAGEAVYALFDRYADRLADAERETTDVFVASAGLEASREVRAAGIELEGRANELQSEHANAREEYRVRTAALIHEKQGEEERSELRELGETAFGSPLFVAREHERALLSLHSEAHGRYDSIAYPRIASFDRMYVEALGADLARLIGGRYDAYRAARRDEFDLHRLDLATRRSDWEATMQAIASRGARQWSESERRMNEHRGAWIDAMQRGYDDGIERWGSRYLSLNEKRADWVEHAAESAVKVGSATVLESIGASAEEAIAEVESIRVATPESGAVDADALVAEALGGFDFGQLLSRGRVMNASISRGRPNILTSVGADRFADGEILHRIREARSTDSAEIEHAVSLVGAERARLHFLDLAADMERRIDRANVAVETSTDRTFRDAGWSISGSRFRRDTLIGDTVFSGAVRERHSVGRYRHFDDYDFGIDTDLSVATLSRMSARGIEAQLDAAVTELQAELEEVFGEEDESAQTVAEAGERVEIDIDRGWFASLFNIGEDSMTVRRQVDAVLQPGSFGEHVGYAPQLRPDIDFDRGWRRSVLFPGAGQMGRLMGQFSYYQAMQAEGYDELSAALHNTPLWHGDHAPTIRSVVDVGVGVAGAFMTGGASLALSVGNAALWGAADAAGGDGTVGEAVLGTAQAATMGGVNALSGAVGDTVSGAIGSGTMAGELAGNLAGAGVSNVGSGLVGAVQIDDVRGLGFSTQAFLETTLGDRALAGYAGSIAGDFAGGTVEGFSAEHAADVGAVGGAIGSGVRAGLEYGMTGETVLNIANVRDIGALAGRQWNSAQLAELHLGGDGAALTVGRGGVDASVSRAVEVAGGLGTFVEQQRMRGYDLLGGAEIASGYDGYRRAATALRSLYSYGDREAVELRDRILGGDTVLRVGYEEEFAASDLHHAFTESDPEHGTTVNLRTLGEHGPSGLTSRLIAGLTMQHEAHRDGYGVGDELPGGTIVTHEQNIAETESAVFARLGMADRMIGDGYGEDLLVDDFLESEYSLYRAAQTTDRLDVFGRYARVGYGAENDDFFAMVSSDGMYQNDLSMRDFLTVALLDGPSREEVDAYNEAHRRELFEKHVEEHGEHAMAYEAFSHRLIEQDQDLLDRYNYNPQQMIDVWSYGCALYSLGYMLNKATGESRNPIELNNAMRENGYYSPNSRGHGTLLSTGNIVAALNSFTDSSTSFELADTFYEPRHVEFDRAHRSENEYFGYLRIAHPDRELRHAFPSGVHSEVVSEVETVAGAASSRDLLTGFVTTANPWDGSRAASGSYLEYIGRTRRAFDEIQRMDLIEVHRHEYDEPYWSRLDLDTGW